MFVCNKLSDHWMALYLTHWNFKVFLSQSHSFESLTYLLHVYVFLIKNKTAGLKLYLEITELKVNHPC